MDGVNKRCTTDVNTEKNCCTIQSPLYFCVCVCDRPVTGANGDHDNSIAIAVADSSEAVEHHSRCIVVVVHRRQVPGHSCRTMVLAAEVVPVAEDSHRQVAVAVHPNYCRSSVWHRRLAVVGTVVVLLLLRRRTLVALGTAAVLTCTVEEELAVDRVVVVVVAVAVVGTVERRPVAATVAAATVIPYGSTLAHRARISARRRSRRATLTFWRSVPPT